MALADSLRHDLKTIGVLEFIHSCEISESEAMIIARYDSEESANAAQPKIREVLGQMTSFMTN